MWLRPGSAASLRDVQFVEPSAGLRCKVRLIMRASKHLVTGTTALPGWRPQRPEICPARKWSRQSLDAARLAATDRCQGLGANQTKDGTRFLNLAGPAAWLWRIRFESRRSGGLNLNLKGAGIRKHTTTGQMSQLPRTIRPETYGNLTRALDFWSHSAILRGCLPGRNLHLRASQDSGTCAPALSKASSFVSS